MRTLFFLAAFVVAACRSTPEHRSIGSIERLDPSLDEIITSDARIEIIGEGYEWSEGPVWVASQKMLLFSDVPANIVYQWTEEKGVLPYLTPSGYTGQEPTQSTEPGSNGLTLDREGHLILCQHGDRRVAKFVGDLASPTAAYITIADRYQGKRFNSPNDAVVRSNGDVFFTDPPYGLPRVNDEYQAKEIPFQGVYKVSTDSTVTLLVDSLTRPNGIAFTPDEKTFIVANSDPAKAIWYAFDLLEGDSVSNARIWFDATSATKSEKGLPDGLRIDKKGNVFATGPGGVWIFNASGKLIGKIKIPEATANCELVNDDKTLFLTSDMYLLRIELRP